MWEYRDTWTGTRYARQISGTTLQVLASHDTRQHLFAFSNLTSYVSRFPSLGLSHQPILIGRGSHDFWRPSGFANHGPRPLYNLQIYVPMSRQQFLAHVSKDPGHRSYIPGEIVKYGIYGEETCVCIKDDVALPLEVYGPEDLQVPTWLNLNEYTTDSNGARVLSPIWTLITSLQQSFYIRAWMSQGYTGQEYRLRYLAEDIHDLRYLCYSQARFQGVKLDVTDERLRMPRVWAEGYIRAFVGADLETEAERSTAMDHLIVIGLVAGEVTGVRYDMPGQKDWVYNPSKDPFPL